MLLPLLGKVTQCRSFSNRSYV